VDDKLEGKQLVGMTAYCFNGFILRDATKATFQVFKTKMAFALAVAIREIFYLRFGSNEVSMKAFRLMMGQECESLLEASGVESARHLAMGMRHWRHIETEYMVVNDGKSEAFVEGKLSWTRQTGCYAIEDFGSNISSVQNIIYRGGGTAAEQVAETARVMTLFGRMAACFLNVTILAMMQPYIDRLLQRDTVVLTPRSLQAHQIPMLSVLLVFVQGARLWMRGCVVSRKGDGFGFETPDQCMAKFQELVMDPVEAMGLQEAERARHLLVHHLSGLVDTAAHAAKALVVKSHQKGEPVRAVCGADLSYFLVGGGYRPCAAGCGKKNHMTTERLFEKFPQSSKLEAWARAEPQRWSENKRKKHVAAYVEMSVKSGRKSG
jgi:hypothetical protein